MVDFEAKLTRGSFHLDIQCRFAAPWTVIFGPSGAGKSTLLRTLAGLNTLEKPDSARIAIHGEYVCDTAIGLNLSPRKRAIGMVTQQPALFPHLSVTENVAYGLAKPGLAKPGLASQAQRIDAMLELAGASHLATRSTRSLSGGEAQRVALARALAPMPRLLLLDEPLSALDAGARDQLLNRLQIWLSEQNIQTILVTHDVADALATEAEVAILVEGKPIAMGPAAEVLAEERKRLLTRLQTR